MSAEMMRSGFNPTLVRLRRCQVFPLQVLIYAFQSHAGSIEAQLPRVPPPARGRSFNPTLVRLRLPGWARTGLFSLRFNPTLVRLRPTIAAVPRIACTGFNPTLVRLRLNLIGCAGLGGVCFNPTLVRLRQNKARFEHLIRKGFQSHAGSIEAGYSPGPAGPRGAVSIPRWFD